MVTVPTLYRKSVTATSDFPFKLTPADDMWLENVDIFVTDQNVYFGDVGTQDALVLANDIWYSLNPINLGDYFFRNATAGSNTRLVAVGTLLTDTRKRLLGIPLG